MNLAAHAEVFKALAHESRLGIVIRLGGGPATAGELAAAVGGEQSTVSRHLAVQKAAGIVEDERKGRTVEYRLTIPCVNDFLRCASTVLKEREPRR